MTVAVITQIAYAAQTLFDPAGTVGRLVDLGKLANYGLLTNYSPAFLFLAGEQGAWYDPSDLTTLYQDSAGTTPVTAVEQPVGLMLDKSKGLVLGPELVTNGDFSNGTAGWTSARGATLSVVSGALRVTQDALNDYVVASQAVSLTIGSWYRLTVDFVGGTASNVQIGIGINNTAADATVYVTAASPRSLTVCFAATATTMYVRASVNVTTNDVYADFDNFSLRQLPGNHAYQSTSANRPVLSARVNLLTKTEDFSDAVAWVKRAGTGSITRTGGFPDPNNGTDAWKIDISASDTEIANGVSGGTGTLPTGLLHSVWIKGTAGETIATSASSDSLNLVTLTGNWQKLSAVATTSYFWIGTWSGSTARTIYVWHPDARPINQGVNLPAYQRVGNTGLTPSDYDTTGFPWYLKCNGTSSAMQTNSIDATAYNKAQVFAGIRKLIDDQGRALLELGFSGVTWGDGSLGLAANDGTSPFQKYQLVSKGSTLTATATGNYPSPLTNILTGICNISGDQAILRVNGTQAAISTADQGIGNYGNYQMFLFARVGKNLWFNGQFYGAVVRFGPTLTDAQITAAEKYLNQKTKAY